jgi:hypothetical protein
MCAILKRAMCEGVTHFCFVLCEAPNEGFVLSLETSQNRFLICQARKCFSCFRAPSGKLFCFKPGQPEKNPEQY